MKAATLIKLLKIKHNTQYYTFKKSDHEMILLKKVGNNQICYNNAIYDKDFFYYHKLEDFIKKIYELRDNYIKKHLNIDLLYEGKEDDLVSYTLKEKITNKITEKRLNIKRWTIRFIGFIKFWKKRQKRTDPESELISFIPYDPNNCDEITGLVKKQYDVLVKAYKYEFEYKFSFDLLNPKIKIEKLYPYPKIKLFFYDWFYILGWKSLKPVYPTFAPIVDWKHYDDDMFCESKNYFDLIMDNDSSPYRLRRLEVYCDFDNLPYDKEIYMYEDKIDLEDDEIERKSIEKKEKEEKERKEGIIKDKEEIMRERMIERSEWVKRMQERMDHKEEMLERHANIVKEKVKLLVRKNLKELDREDDYDEWFLSMIKNNGLLPTNLDVREKLTFRTNYHPLDAGTRYHPKWIEEKYDEQKKFNEFDINCKTNSYHTRYIVYNELYNKDYPEHKKFKTDLIHDFTEEELQENYENMINKEKTALDKFNFVMFNEKRKNAVLKFFEELEIIEVSHEKLIYNFHWNHDRDSDMLLNQEVDILLHELLNNPRYILVMPLVDAYFEVYRRKGYHFGDESFSGPQSETSVPLWGDTGTHKKFMKHLKYFDFSYERQYLFAKKWWLIEDYLEIEDFEYVDEYEDDFWTLTNAFLIFFGLVILNFYVLYSWFFKFDIPFQLSDIILKYHEVVDLCVFDETQVELRQLMCPEVYYGLELKRPRARIKTKRIILPFKFYEPGYYSYAKRRAWRMLPFSLLERICFDLDEKDFGLSELHVKLFEHGRSYLIWQLRFPFIEWRYPWDDEVRSPVTRVLDFIKRNITDVYFDFDEVTGKNKAPRYHAFLDKYVFPFWEQKVVPKLRVLLRGFLKHFKEVQNYYKEYKQIIINFVQENTQRIINLWKDFKQTISDFFKKPTN